MYLEVLPVLGGGGPALSFWPLRKHISHIPRLFSGLGTRGEDVDQLVDCIRSRLPVLTCTLQMREVFKQEVTGTAGLLYVDDPNWPGIGVVRYAVALPPDVCFSLPCRPRVGHVVSQLRNGS